MVGTILTKSLTRALPPDSMYTYNMNIFFDATYSGFEKYGENYKAIFGAIEKAGHHCLNDDPVKLTQESYVEEMKQGRSAQIEYYNRKMTTLKKADICIFEVSKHSLGIGYMIQRALEEGKPTILLYLKGNEPFFLEGDENERLMSYSYEDNTIEKVVEKALNEADELRDKRFNFFISPKLLRYLDKVGKEQRITKSVFIRNLILEHMRKYK